MATADGVTLACFMRKAVARFSSAPSTRVEIAAFLGLPPDASDAEMMRALEALLKSWGESDAGPSVPSVSLAARPTPAAIAGVRALAAARRVTPRALLLSATAAVAGSNNTAPTPEQVAALNAIVAALGLPQDAGRKTVLAAIQGLLDAMAELPAPAGPRVPSVEVPALQLSAETLAKLKAKGMTVPEFLSARAKAVRRSH